MWLYETSITNSERYILGESGTNNLIVIGVNPSTATPTCLDPTLKNVKKIATLSGYDGWIMINLYPQRATNPKNLHNIKDTNIYNENLMRIRKIFTLNNTIWAAWGTLITKRSYLKQSLEDIYKISMNFQSKWISYGKTSKNGHPHHPLYLAHDSQHEYFDIKNYIAKLI